MAEDFEFSIIARFEDRASRGVESLREKLQDLNEAGRGRGLLGGLFGRFARTGGMRGPGGLGGIVSGLGRLTSKLVAIPGKVVSAFSNFLPKIGGIASSAVDSVVNVLQGIVVAAGKIAGHVVNILTSAFKRVASFAGRVFGKVAKWGSVAFAGITAFSVRQAGKVQNAWNKVRTILQLGPREAKEMMAALRDEAIRTGKGTVEVIEGFYQVLSAGFQRPQRALKLLRTSLEASVGGWTQLPTVVKLASRTMRAFQRPVSDVREVMDSLMQTIHTGQIEMPELASLFGRLGNTAAEAKLSLEETLAMLGVIARMEKPQEVVTMLQAALMKLNNQTGQARDALQQLADRGLDLRPQAIEEIGLGAWLERLEEAKQRFPKLMSKIFPERAARGVTNLVKSIDDINAALGSIQNSAGTTRDDFTTMMDSVPKAASQAWVTVKQLARDFGKPTADWLVSIRDRLAESGMNMDWFRQKARAAGEAVKEAFQGAWQWVSRIAEGRELSFEGVVGGIREAASRGASAAWKEIQALWPTFKSTIATWLDEIWAMIGDDIAALPSMIGRALQRTASEQMTQMMESLAEKRGGFWKKALRAISDPQTQIGLGELWRNVTGRLGPAQAAKFKMLQTMANFGQSLTGVGSAMGASASTARQRSRQRERRENMRQRQQRAREAARRQRRVWRGRETLESMIARAYEDERFTARERWQITEQAEKLGRLKGLTNKELERLRQETHGLLNELLRREEANRQQIERMVEDLRQLGISRS